LLGDVNVPDHSSYGLSAEERAALRQMTLAHNRCNLPSNLIASLDYQHFPIPIEINSLEPWLLHFKQHAIEITSAAGRAHYFQQVMKARFGVETATKRAHGPSNQYKHYRKLLLGWIFNSDSAHGAIWRQWVESRFGLLTRYHQTSINSPDSDAYFRYLHSSLPISNEQQLYEQLDFLYCYCQLELSLRYTNQTHITLYRGFSSLSETKINGKKVACFNNLSSLTTDPELAFQFGSDIVKVKVPISKIVCFDSLLPKVLHGEQEYMVLGGLYEIEKVSFF
jgi:NAD+--dinitrogen-reductase ADP-D-ribosyltransferase